MNLIQLTWEQVNAWRMQQHGLTTRADKSAMFSTISRLGAIQAQVMSAAELQIAARVDGITSEDIQAALWGERQLVKSWFLRGTLHLLSAADYPLYIAALSTLKHFRRGSWLKFHDITPEEFDAMMAGIRGVLTKTGMTREALADAIATHTNAPKLKEKLLSGWGAMLKPASFSGDLCFGENIGQNVTFVRPRDWLGDVKSIDPQAALAEILRRYLNAYAPSTPDEFARWFGFEPSDAKKIFKSIAGELSEVEVEGWKATVLTASLPDIQAAKPSGMMRLLPYFDVYTIAVAKQAESLMPAEHKAKVYRPQGWISPVLIDDGRIIGTWEYETKKAKILVTLFPFEPLTTRQKDALFPQVQRLALFFGGNVEVIWG